ncbi:MAG TPA: hypothetical protein ENN30_02765 [Candidatus Woesearchaeota archaeon]|nr:hypothetical protein [Candidatus Woesearchaeota archaeon]
MTARQIVEKRLEAVASGNEQLINGWLLNYFYTPDAVAYSGDEIKIVPNCKLLIDIDSDAELDRWGMVLTEEQYKQLEGKTFQRADLSINKGHTKQEAKGHPVWQAELGDLLGLCTEMVFAEGKRGYGSEKAMSICLGKRQEKPMLHAFVLGGLGGGSGLFDKCNLDSINIYSEQYDDLNYFDNEAYLVGAIS